MQQIKMKKRYGCIKSVRVYILDKASKYEKKGYLAIQSITTGETASVHKNRIKKITSKFPNKKYCK